MEGIGSIPERVNYKVFFFFFIALRCDTKFLYIYKSVCAFACVRACMYVFACAFMRDRERRERERVCV